MFKQVIDVSIAMIAASNTAIADTALISDNKRIDAERARQSSVLLENSDTSTQVSVGDAGKSSANELPAAVETIVPPVSVEEAVPPALNFDYDIASYVTKYSQRKSDANRNFNMQLAIEAIHGTVLQPGDSFSYNQTILSKRNKSRDYKQAGILIDGKPATGIGGGICQVSSTLFEAALYSGMTITERHNHSARVGYMPAGRDATVSWGGPDLKFQNNLAVPVMIDSTMANGVMKIRFLAAGDPGIGAVKVSVQAKAGVYYLYRYQNGVLNYTTKSIYK